MFVIKEAVMNTRLIRVKSSNQAAIIAALIEAGFTAIPSCSVPLAEQEYYKNSFSSYEEWSEDSKVGMTAILTSASGHQAHKVICALKDQGSIN